MTQNRRYRPTFLVEDFAIGRKTSYSSFNKCDHRFSRLSLGTAVELGGIW